jgi:hypothetical protein
MSTITENLQVIKNSMLDIKHTILDKGGTIIGDITTWDNSITNIPSGGSSSSGKGDVTFYDYDGTIIHSFSKDEFIALGEMPPLPTRKGLICQEWNWPYEDAVKCVVEFGEINIGAVYITDDGKTRLYIRIDSKEHLNVPIYFDQTVANGVTVDWGDGSATQTYSNTGNINTSHNYSNIGDYCISFDITAGYMTLGEKSSAGKHCIMGSVDKYNRIYCNMLRKVEIGVETYISICSLYYCAALETITVPAKSSTTTLGISAFEECRSLKCFICPSDCQLFGSCFYNCHSLRTCVLGKAMSSLGHSVFYNCYNLSNIYIQEYGIIPGSCFYNCYSLGHIMFSKNVASIQSKTFYNCYGITCYDFSNRINIPTLDSTDAFTGISSTCKIVVPDNLYDEWITATNWNTYASYIIKKSDWDAL